MSEFRFILNGTELQDHPDGMDDFTEALVRNEELHGMTLEYNGELVFHGDGYKILRDIWEQNECARVDLLIEFNCGDGVFELITEMTVVVTDINEDLAKCIATVSPIDSGYYALIHNNRSLKVDMRAEKTKNGEEMTPCESIPLKFFLPEIAPNGGVYVSEAQESSLIGTYLDNGLTFGNAPNYAWEGTIDQIPGEGPFVPGFFRTEISQSPYSAIWTLAWYDDNGDLQEIHSDGFDTPLHPWEAVWFFGTTGLVVEESGYVVYQDDEKDRAAYDVIKVLEHVLTYITDGEITDVKSEFLDSLIWNDKPINPSRVVTNVSPDEMSFALLSGAEIRKNTGEFLRVDFESIVKTLFSTYNLFWVIEDGVFHIEPFNYWFGDREMELLHLPELSREVDSSKLYSQITAGSKNSINDRDLKYSLPLFDLTAHAVQEYTVGGKCNTDARLEITSDITYDSNIIEHLVLNEIAVKDDGAEPDDSYDEDVVMVQYGLINDVAYALYDATFIRNDLDPPKGLVYNPELYNNRIISRHTTNGTISIYEGGDSDNFRAEATNPDSSVEFVTMQVEPALSLNSIQEAFLNSLFPGRFPEGLPVLEMLTDVCEPAIQIDDTTTPPNFDSSGNWDTNEFWYQAPVSGVYGFEIKMLPRKYSDMIRLKGTSEDIPISSNPANPNYLQNTIGSIEIEIDIIDASGNVANTLPVPWVLSGGGSPAVTEYNKFLFWTAGQGLISLGNVAEQTIGLGYSSVFNGRLYGRAQNIQQTGPVDSIFMGNQSGPTRRIVTYLPEGWRVRPRVILNIGKHYRDTITDVYRRVTWGIAAGSWIRSTFVQTGGGVLPAISVDEHMMIDYFTENPITFERWKQMKANPSLGIGLSTSDMDIVDTYVSRIERNLQTNNCEFKTITSRSRL